MRAVAQQNGSPTLGEMWKMLRGGPDPTEVTLRPANGCAAMLLAVTGQRGSKKPHSSQHVPNR